MSDSVFLSTESKTIGRRLVSGPVGLPGFSTRMSTPFPMSSSSLSCKASLKMLAIVCESSSAEHLRNSTGISSCPLARQVLSLPIASVTSSGVIGRVNCGGSAVNASSLSTFPRECV